MRKLFTALLLALCSIAGYAQQEPMVATPTDLFDMSLEDLLSLDLVDKNFYLYGYINSNLQKTFSYPSLNGAETIQRNDPTEWTPVRNFHIYGQGNLSKNIAFLFNLAHNDGLVEVRNAWGNFLVKDAFQIRIGKMYRKFGLYNERLDQVPTFIGIEPPEMLDTDHLFLERTTNFMVHGNFNNGKRSISYALMTDNGEGGPAQKLFALGWDLRYKSFTESIIVGTSGYSSSINGEKTVSTVSLGAGPANTPNGLLTPGDVVVSTSFNVQTWYLRLGYDVQTDVGQFVPYVFLDWMSHPEVIQNKDFGGDNEAGLADDGKFLKPSLGVVYRPIPSVALKLDGSVHTQKFNGKTVSYPELRLDFSFAFSNIGVEKALKSDN
ncbi:MAG: hypothetical protein EBU52_14750 [Cytophagia bacterium]|nr:hypothetical protein [Cytophagia bacterium]